MSNVVDIEKLKSIVGEAAFDDLIRQMPGQNLYIPRNFNEKYPNRKQRNLLIRSDYFGGMEVPDLMIKYGLSKSRIHHILADRQGTK
jgi:Mor family transcriptional regulator